MRGGWGGVGVGRAGVGGGVRVVGGGYRARQVERLQPRQEREVGEVRLLRNGVVVEPQLLEGRERGTRHCLHSGCGQAEGEGQG